MRSENLTNETHFPLLSASSEPPVKPLDVAGGSAASHFNMSVLCAWKRGIFPGSLTASRVLISQRIGSLDTHGRLRAFKQSSPPTKKTHRSLPKRHPAPHYSPPDRLPPPRTPPLSPSPGSPTLCSVPPSPVGDVKEKKKKGCVRLCFPFFFFSTFKEPAGLNRVISLNVHTALATSEECKVDEAGLPSNQTLYLPHLG